MYEMYGKFGILQFQHLRFIQMSLLLVGKM